VCVVKLNLDGSLAHFEAHLLVKGYFETYRVKYHETSPVAKMAFVRLLISLAASSHWTLHQLNVKNTILYGTLEEVYMKQLPGFVPWGIKEGVSIT